MLFVSDQFRNFPSRILLYFQTMLTRQIWTVTCSFRTDDNRMELLSDDPVYRGPGEVNWYQSVQPHWREQYRLQEIVAGRVITLACIVTRWLDDGEARKHEWLHCLNSGRQGVPLASSVHQNTDELLIEPIDEPATCRWRDDAVNARVLLFCLSYRHLRQTS